MSEEFDDEAEDKKEEKMNRKVFVRIEEMGCKRGPLWKEWSPH